MYTCPSVSDFSISFVIGDASVADSRDMNVSICSLIHQEFINDEIARDNADSIAQKLLSPS